MQEVKRRWGRGEWVGYPCLLRTRRQLCEVPKCMLHPLSRQDVHSRYRTEAHQDVVGRFNERFILSLSSCQSCLVVDDQLNILPVSTLAANIVAVPRPSQVCLSRSPTCQRVSP